MAIGEPEIQQVSNQLQLQLAMRKVTCRASGSDTVAAVLQRSASLQTHTPPVHSIRTGSATAWTVDMSVGGGEVVFPPSHLGQAAPQRVAGQGLLDAVVAVSRLRLRLWLRLGLGFWLPLSVLAGPLPDSIKYCLLLRHNIPTACCAEQRNLSVASHASPPASVGGRAECALHGVGQLLQVEALLELVDDGGHAGGHVELQLVPAGPQPLLHLQLQLVPAALALQHLGVVVDPHVALETEHAWTVAHV